MNKNIIASFKFLITEYKRLKLKEKNSLTNEEKETLQKLISFIEKENEE